MFELGKDRGSARAQRSRRWKWEPWRQHASRDDPYRCGLEQSWGRGRPRAGVRRRICKPEGSSNFVTIHPQPRTDKAGASHHPTHAASPAMTTQDGFARPIKQKIPMKW